MIKKVLLLAVVLICFTGVTFAENVGPKEIIEKEAGFRGWQRIEFNDALLKTGFIYGNLAIPDHKLKMNQPVKIKTEKVYLPNEHYMDVRKCEVIGHVTDIETVKQTRYKILVSNLSCSTKGKVTNYKINGYVSGHDNFTGLTEDDLNPEKKEIVYIYLLPNEK